MGGYFTEAGGNSAIHLARWYTDTTLGTGSWADGRPYKLAIHPNPASGGFTVQADLKDKAGHISFYNLQGKLIVTLSVTEGLNTLAVSTTGWAKGVYICKLEADGKALQSKRVVVE